MAKKLSASVGKGGKNKPDDVLVVQKLLNACAKKAGFKKLEEDSLNGPNTMAAIAKFQKAVVDIAKPDSRVDPGGVTSQALKNGAKKPPEKKSDKKTEEKKAAPRETGCKVNLRVVCPNSSGKGKRGLAGVEVKLAGKTVKTRTNGELSLTVKPGKHRFEVDKSGYKLNSDRAVEIRAIDGGTINGLVIELRPE